MSHQFLSEEWMTAAKAIREKYADQVPPVTVSIRMNQVITDVPFGEGTINAYLDTSSGVLEMELGALETPDLTLTTDYATAKAILVDGNPQAGMQAFMAGKIKVQGDMTKLMAMQQTAPDPGAVERRRHHHDAQVVALSFSAAFPVRQAGDGLAALRAQLLGLFTQNAAAFVRVLDAKVKKEQPAAPAAPAEAKKPAAEPKKT